MAEAPVEIVPYDVSWPARFEVERNRLQQTISPWLAGPIEHVGSTAVPGLAAIPVITSSPPCTPSKRSRPALEVLAGLDYCYAPYRSEAEHWFCKPSPAFRTHHLHLVPCTSPQWLETLAFRDYLRSHPGPAAEL